LVHKFIFDETRIVLDVNSGTVHLVDEMAWEIINQYPNLDLSVLYAYLEGKHSQEEINEARSEVQQLIKEGLLFSQDFLKGLYRPPENRVVKALCLHLAHSCNLACRYCFADKGQYYGASSLMSAETGKKAIDFLLTKSGKRKYVEIDFFGGEPLLNFNGLKKIVAYGKKQAAVYNKEIKFTVTTNGLLLTEEISRFLKNHKIFTVLSIDGRPRANDRMRVFPNGQGTYRRVLENISRHVSFCSEEDYYLRGTFTRHNLDFASDFLHLADLGFRYISLEPVVASPEKDYAFQPEDIPYLEKEYAKLARLLLNYQQQRKEIRFFHFEIDLNGGPCLIKRLTGCGAGQEYLAVAPDESLYPCHQFVGRQEYCLGNLEQGITRPQLREQFCQAYIYNKESCAACWARFYCGGGCHANNIAFNDSIFSPDPLFCRLMKKRLECALYLQVKNFKKNFCLNGEFENG
jgi:uncharacterized protein